jgi:molybdenum cofactor cytidylyltransferase
MFNIKHRNVRLSAIILAGGNSSRMNYPKPWLKLNHNHTFLSAIISAFKQFGIDDIVVVLNDKFTTNQWTKELLEVREHSTVIPNLHPEKGRLYSLHLGLNKTINNTVFIHNVDNPFVEKEVLQQLSCNIETKGITIPSYQDKGGHPVIINQKVKNEIINNYQHYETLKDIFIGFSKKYIEVNNNSILKNINTPQELEEMKYELA